MKRTQLVIASVFLGVAACGGIVRFSSDVDTGENECEGKPCGEPCEDGGACTGDGTCSFDQVFCCVLGGCGDACSICTDDECVDGFCTEDGACVDGGVACPL